MNKRIGLIILLISYLTMSYSFGQDRPKDNDREEDAPEGESCSLDAGFNFDELFKMTKSQCTDKGGLINKCRCLHNEIQTNEFVAEEVRKGTENYFNEIEKNKDSYRKVFNHVYEKVTIQAAAQEEVLGLSDKSKPVGCTPEDMSQGVKKKIIASNEKQIEGLRTKAAEAKDEFKECNSKFFNVRQRAFGCNFFSNRATMLEAKIIAMEKKTEGCGLSMNAFASEDSIEKMKDVVTFLDSPKFRSGVYDDVKQVASLWVKFLNGENVDEQVKGIKGGCVKMLEKYTGFMQTHKKFSGENSAGADFMDDNSETAKSPHCKADDTVCLGFAGRNESLEEKMIEDNDTKADECVTYAEYTTYKGMPSPELLKELNNSKHPESLFVDTPANRRNPHRIKFLQANPLLAVIAKEGTDKDKKKLGAALKSMAGKMLVGKELSEPEKFKNYIDFMKGDFKDIYSDSRKSSAMAVCEELQRNFTAIELANDLPPIGWHVYEKKKKPEQVIRRCIGKVYEDSRTSDLDEDLNLSPIYVLGIGAADAEPTVTKFQDFKKAYCGGFAEHRAKSEECKEGKDPAKCRDSFTAGKFAPLREKIIEGGVLQSLNKENFDNIASKTDPKAQDQEYKDYWQKEVGDKLDQNVFGGPATAQNNQSMMFNSDINSGYNQTHNLTPTPAIAGGTGSQDVVPDEGFTRSSEDSNHVRPDFNAKQSTNSPITNFSNVKPDQFKQIEEIKDLTPLDPNFNNRSNEDKLSSYKALDEFRNKNPGILPKFDPEETIQKLENTIAKTDPAIGSGNSSGKTEEAKVDQGPAPANYVPRNITPPVSNAAVLSQFPGSSPRASNPGVKEDKAKASYEKALLNMGTGQIIIQGEYAEGPYEVPRSNIITADAEDGVYPFSDLSRPDRLSEFLANRLGDKVQNGESVMIKKPGTQDYFVVKATKKDGITSYQLIPFVKKEEIKLYSNLKNLFKNIK